MAIKLDKENSRKRYSVFDFHPIPFTERTITKKHSVRTLPLNKKFPPGTGTIYAWQFGMSAAGADSYSGDGGARLTYIGLSFQNPTSDRIDQHKEGTKMIGESSEALRLDYLAFAAARFNERQGAKVLDYDQMVDVIDVVSIFDLALMEIYYIHEKYKTERNFGAGGYSSFDDYLNQNNAIERKGGRLQVKSGYNLLGLNTGAGGEGGALNKDIFRPESESAIITVEDLVFGALYFLEDKAPQVLEARRKYYGTTWEPTKDRIKQKFPDLFKEKNSEKALNDSQVFLAFSILYVIQWFSDRGTDVRAEINIDGTDVKNVLKGSLKKVKRLNLTYVQTILNNIKYDFKPSENPLKYSSTDPTQFNPNSIKDKYKGEKAGKVLAMLYSAGSTVPITKKAMIQAILTSLSSASYDKIFDIAVELTQAGAGEKLKVQQVLEKQKAILARNKDVFEAYYENALTEALSQIDPNIVKPTSLQSTKVSAIIKKAQASIKKETVLKARGNNKVLFYDPIKRIVDGVVNDLKALGIELAEDEQQFLQYRVQNAAYIVTDDFRKGK